MFQSEFGDQGCLRPRLQCSGIIRVIVCASDMAMPETRFFGRLELMAKALRHRGALRFERASHTVAQFGHVCKSDSVLSSKKDAARAHGLGNQDSAIKTRQSRLGNKDDDLGCHVNN